MLRRMTLCLAFAWIAFTAATPLAGAAAPGATTASAPSVSAPPAFYAFAPTPPMGWNSYDAFGDSVTEDEVMANASYVKDKLRPHGWNYIVIDFRWYDPEPTGDDHALNQKRTGAKLAADPFGRLVPAENRFPSSAGGKGFKPLADKLHALGLKFGVHYMRGIPRQAVQAKIPIADSDFTAAEAGDPSKPGEWCPDMFGVRNNDAGQAWYDSLFKLFAAWGVDFVKVDDICPNYRTAESAMIRRAIDKSGRAIVYSISAGPPAQRDAQHVQTHVNMFRISTDFWDRWSSLSPQFDLMSVWHDRVGPGCYADADMLPLGHICIRSKAGGNDRVCRFTHDEQITLMSFWCLAPSPLMLGGNLPDNTPWDLDLITNDEVIALDQDPLVRPATRVSQHGARGGRGTPSSLTEVWVRELKDGSRAAGLFNRGEKEAEVTLIWDEAKLSGNWTARDLWQHKNLGTFDAKVALPVPPHGAVLLKLSSTGK
jgi:alpha-galactosidase